jgi:hypothetical protein
MAGLIVAGVCWAISFLVHRSNRYESSTFGAWLVISVLVTIAAVFG